MSILKVFYLKDKKQIGTNENEVLQAANASKSLSDKDNFCDPMITSTEYFENFGLTDFSDVAEQIECI